MRKPTCNLRRSIGKALAFPCFSIFFMQSEPVSHSHDRIHLRKSALTKKQSAIHTTPLDLVPCSCESPKAIPQAMPGRGIDTGYHGIMVVLCGFAMFRGEFAAWYSRIRSLDLGCWHLWADSGRPHFGNPMKSLCISPGLWQPEAPKPKNPKSPSMVMTKRPVHQTHGFLHHF